MARGSFGSPSVSKSVSEISANPLANQPDRTEREKMLQQMAENLTKNLAERTDAATQARIQRPLNRIKNALIGLAMLVPLALLHSFIMGMAGSDTSPGVQFLSMAINALVFLGGGLAMLMLVWGAVEWIALPGLLSSVSVTPQQISEKRFEDLKRALRGMVSNKVEEQLVTAVDDLYAIQKGFEQHPELKDERSQMMGQMIGQTLVAGSLLKEMEDYEKTRHQPKQLDSKGQKLKEEETALIHNLQEDQTELVNQIQNASLQLSLVRGEILKLESETVRAKELTTGMGEIYDRVASVHQAMREVNQAAEGKLIAARA